jgi:hypothetical protein
MPFAGNDVQIAAKHATSAAHSISSGHVPLSKHAATTILMAGQLTTTTFCPPEGDWTSNAVMGHEAAEIAMHNSTSKYCVRSHQALFSNDCLPHPRPLGNHGRLARHHLSLSITSSLASLICLTRSLTTSAHTQVHYSKHDSTDRALHSTSGAAASLCSCSALAHSNTAGISWSA